MAICRVAGTGSIPVGAAAGVVGRPHAEVVVAVREGGRLALYVDGKSVAGRPIVIREVETNEEMAHCQILFISDSEKKRLGERLIGENEARRLATATSGHRGKELNLLSRIDKMILRGATERDALQEVAHLTAAFTGYPVASVVVPNVDGKSLEVFHGRAETRELLAQEQVPFGEGVAGWAILQGAVATSPNVFNDARYGKLRELARRVCYTAAAAAPVILDGEVLGAVAVGRAEEHHFTTDELATRTRIADQSAIAVAHARQRRSLQELAHETAVALSDAIESRDPYTGDHCSRLAQYATLTATALTLPAKEIEAIRLGAALHDIGKITVPDAILKKPDKLTPDEYAIIKQHCYSGGQICKARTVSTGGLPGRLSPPRAIRRRRLPRRS